MQLFIRSRRVVAMSAFALALVLAAAACSPAATTPAPTTTPVASTDTGTGEIQLAGTSWLLISYMSPVGTSYTVPMAITPTLVFGDGTVNGNAGCNTFSGTWTLEGDVIAFGGPVESTGNPCEDPGGKIETAYLANLALVNRVRMNGENLVLHQNQGEGFAALEYVPASN